MRSRGAYRLAPVVVALLTFVAFLPALQAGFVTWDDDGNFVNNLNYRGLGWTQLRWMWTTFHLGHYVPLSWMTLGLDYVVWGMNPAGYHFTSVALHTANAVILYFVALRLLRLGSDPGSADRGTMPIFAAFAALLFAIHPLRVESVAWITERRDVLSEFFYLLCVLFYLRSCELPAQRRWYAAALAACACALLSKGTAVTIPAVLLILNVFPLRRLGSGVSWTSDGRRVLLELIPFVVLAAGAGVVSIIALRPPDQLSALAKLAVSSYSVSFYLWKTIAPFGLSPLYEMPRAIDPGATAFIVSYAVVIAMVGLAWYRRSRWPAATTALLVLVAISLPMLGIVQNGPQIAADRYTYHAAPALAVLAAVGLYALGRARLSASVALGASILLVLGALAFRQSRIWHDSDTLWAQVVRVDSNSAIGHVAIGSLLFNRGRVEEAIVQYRQGIELNPAYAEGHDNLGVALAHQGRVAEAIEQYERAIAIKPTQYEAQNNWGVALASQGDLAAAVQHYRLALATAPDYADAQVNWGNALVRLGKRDEAIEHYRQAVRIRPDNADAQHNWGVALAQQGNLADAIRHFRLALVANPQHAEARQYLLLASQLQQQRR